jgi:hypothetical protein
VAAAQARLDAALVRHGLGSGGSADGPATCQAVGCTDPGGAGTPGGASGGAAGAENN